MANNKITVIQESETIQVVQPSNEIVVTVNQDSNVVTVVEKGPKGDKGDSGSASDLNAINSFTGSIQAQVNALNQATSSYLTASLLDSYVLTSTLNLTLGSYAQNSVTASFVTNSQTSSFVTNSSTSSFVTNSQTASFITNSVTASMLSSYVLNSSTSSFITNSVTSSFATIGTNTFSGTQTISGSLTITQNLTVLNGATIYGSSSLQYITASQLTISSSFISVNVFEPVERFGGLKVYDSGSSLATASLAWDSLHNHWVYQNVSGTSYSGGMLLSGPRNTGSLGDEPTLSRYFIPRSDGGDHLDNSQIYSSASVTQITGSLTVTQGITASLFGTASWSTNAISSSYSATASYINTLNQNLIITGSTQGNVVALSIASNTASLNLNLGNFFTLQLVPGVDTYVNPSNIKPGQSSLLLISTTGSGTVSFPSSVKQPSGSSYTATTTTGTDILTFASLDNTNLYVVNVKNLI